MFDFKAFLDLNNLRQNDAAAYFSTNRAKIAQVSTGRTRLPQEWVDKVEEDGVYMIPDPEDPTKPRRANPYEVELTDANSLKYYYELEASAGNVDFADTAHEAAPFRRLFFPSFAGCVGLNVMGDSMSPLARNGDIVAVQPTPVDTIANGEIYLIATNDGQRMIKRLVRCKLEDGTDAIRCVSENADKSLYGDFFVEASEVATVHRVRGFVSCVVLS